MRKGFTLIELMIVIAIIAIIAAIAIPNLLESRVTANEAAASTSLKSGVFPAAVQFQAGSYQDADIDNVGEYGTITAMAGKIATLKVGANELKLVTGPLATEASGTAQRSANGYLFMSHIPSLAATMGGATTSQWLDADAACPVQAGAAPINANNGEQRFTYGAAPQRYSDTGRRVFVITEDGMTRSPSLAANLANWFGGAPTSGDVPSDAEMLRGMADARGAAAAGVTQSDLPAANTTYPTVAR